MVGSQFVRRFVFSLAFTLGASCGGGGGGGPPQPTFTFSVPGASVDEGAAPLGIQVVLHTTLPSLTKPASVDVVDLGNGSGTAGTDYAPFAPQKLTFPIGSVDGDSQTVTLTALVDQQVEGAVDTVRLGLQNSVGGHVAGNGSFVADVEDIDRATIQFASAASTTPDESSGPRTVTLALDLPAGVTLAVAATAQVADTGAGSASPGSDYTAFPAQTVTFPIGSADAATKSVTVQILGDIAIEIDETVRLAVSDPSTGTDIGLTSIHVLTIADDDALGPAALVATEGATGVENSLAYDELVDLGAQGVGDGPNAGTLVRITNAGGSPMDLGAPRLTGTHADDFVVEVESAPLAPPGVGEEFIAPDVATPLVRVPGEAYRLDAQGLRSLRALTRAKMHGFPLPGFGDATLELRRVPLPIAPGAVLRVDGTDVPGGLAAAVGDLTFWSGSVVEVPDSKVFLALASQGSRGFVELPFAGNRIVRLVPEKGSSLVRLVRDADMPAEQLAQGFDFCNEPRLVPGSQPELSLDALPMPGTEDLTAADCTVAIETDYQLYDKFDSVAGTTAYVTQMMAAISDQYFVDVQTTLSIAYLGVHSNANDGWDAQENGGGTSGLLDEFRAAWAPNNWPVSANLAHFVSGASLGGGVAYLNVLCNSTYGFGVSGNIGGTINWGNWTGQPGNFTWDFVVVAHEMGHNFGASHTHTYCPPLDLCYSNCNTPPTTACSQGTLMSYCHLCGGMDNIDLEFGPMIANIMRSSVNASCLGLSSLAGGDHVQYLVRFAPWGATGTRTAALQFAHDAPNATQPFRIQLRGTAAP